MSAALSKAWPRVSTRWGKLLPPLHLLGSRRRRRRRRISARAAASCHRHRRLHGRAAAVVAPVRGGTRERQSSARRRATRSMPCIAERRRSCCSSAPERSPRAAAAMSRRRSRRRPKPSTSSSMFWRRARRWPSCSADTLLFRHKRVHAIAAERRASRAPSSSVARHCAASVVCATRCARSCCCARAAALLLSEAARSRSCMCSSVSPYLQRRQADQRAPQRLRQNCAARTPRGLPASLDARALALGGALARTSGCGDALSHTRGEHPLERRLADAKLRREERHRLFLRRRGARRCTRGRVRSPRTASCPRLTR